ncbi:MAG: hypothetical protein HY978_03215 [Candidatus Liptonbacteria bacterium]|nr:hypothetical protein [Candidatus Liptonbacteria bacterium]
MYLPIADPDWVAKVLRETVTQIPRNKIELGIPTFGYEYGAVSASSTAWQQEKLRSVTYQSASELARQVSTTPQRNLAGELMFRYTASTSTLPARIVSFPDANSTANLITLARRFRLRGVTIFKLDGESDPNLWQVLR